MRKVRTYNQISDFEQQLVKSCSSFVPLTPGDVEKL